MTSLRYLNLNSREERDFLTARKLRRKIFLATISRQKGSRLATHFNFGKIKTIQTIDPSEIQIELFESSPNFLRQLMHPEFGVLHRSDLQRYQDGKKPTFNPSSGPYFLREKDSSEIVLERNRFFSDASKSAPERVTVLPPVAGNRGHSQDREDLDFSIVGFPGDITQKAEGKAGYSFIVPNIGFSYWFSMNPKSRVFTDSRIRAKFQAIVHEFASEFFNKVGFPREKAEQLYLPGGLGRPSHSELDLVWQAIKAVAAEEKTIRDVIKVLIPSGLPFENELLEHFEKNHLHLEKLWYSNQDEFVQKINSEGFDAFLNDNDFLSFDLFENLQLTFSSSRPLIMLSTSESPVLEWIDDAGKSTDNDFRCKKYKNIALRVLSEGLIASLAYNRIGFLLRSDIDVRAWSRVFPEISMCKIKIN